MIGFWTALARVQDSFFWMNRMMTTKALSLTDDELRDIVWLTNEVRNDLTHFIPKYYTIDVPSIRSTGLTAVRAIEFLATRSYAVHLRSEEKRRRLSTALETLKRILDA